MLIVRTQDVLDVFWKFYGRSLTSCVKGVAVCILKLVAFGQPKTYLAFPSKKLTFLIIYVALEDLFFSF